MFPEWLEYVRLLGTLMIWLIVPLLIWFIIWSVRQHQKWEAGKMERYERWKAGMDEVSQTREEVIKLRAQAEITLAHAEVALAQARQQSLRHPGNAADSVRTNGLGSPATTAQESPYQQSVENI